LAIVPSPSVATMGLMLVAAAVLGTAGEVVTFWASGAVLPTGMV
jgi:hypothetical protein